jgi:hypothetical protein
MWLDPPIFNPRSPVTRNLHEVFFIFSEIIEMDVTILLTCGGTRYELSTNLDVTAKPRKTK